MEKKKSKKPFQASNANDHMENINLSQTDLQSQKKKKKKKKENDERNQSISQQSMFNIEESVAKKREHEEVEENSHKKKKKKKKKSNKEEENTALQISAMEVHARESTPRSKINKKEQNELQIVEEVAIDENWWPPEERKVMLEAMKTQIPVTGRFTRVGYLTHLRRTKWEDVLSSVNKKTQGNSRTTKQCQDQFHRILNKVGTIKSLNQILDEALSLASDPGALRREVLQARHRFVRDYMSKHKGEEDCTMMSANRVWLSLPAEEKDKWEEEYKNELQLKGLLDVKTKSKKLEGPENCKFPFELYRERRAAKGEELSSSFAKSKYASLALKKKLPFIVESIRQQKIYEVEASKYLEKNPTWKKIKAHGPTVKEVRDYLESLELPIAPPNHVIGMYYADNKEKFMEENPDDSETLKAMNDAFKPYNRARESFNKLPRIHQDQYKSDWRKSWIQYVSAVDKWKPMIEEKYPEILEQAQSALAEVKVPKNLTEQSEKKPVRKKPVDPLSHIDRRNSSLTNIKFFDEPPLPARTAFELFQQKFKRDAGANYAPAKAKEFWGRLSEAKKSVYADRLNVLKERSKNNFISYARKLESEQREIFVGIKRSILMKYFLEDIFAVDYPGADYPILVAPQKKNTTVHVAKDMETIKEPLEDFDDVKEDEEQEEGEEDEEEEEEEEEANEEQEESCSNSNSNSESSASDSDSQLEA